MIRVSLQWLIACALCLLGTFVLVGLAALLGGGVQTMAATVLAWPADGVAGSLDAAARAMEPTNASSHLLRDVLERLGRWFAQNPAPRYGIAPLIAATAIARGRGFRALVARWTAAPPPFLAHPKRQRKSRAVEPFAEAQHEAVFAELKMFATGPERRLFQGLWGTDEATISHIASAWLEHMSRDRGWDAGPLRGGHIPSGWVPVRPTAIFIDHHIESVDELCDRLADLRHVVEGEGGARIRILLSSAVDFGWIFSRRDPALFDALLPRLATAQSSEEAAAGLTTQGSVIGSAVPLRSKDGDVARGFDPAEDASLRMEGFLRVAVSNPGAAADETVDHAARLLGSDGLKLVCLAAVAGPAPARLRALLSPRSGDQQALAELFPHSAFDLANTIPPLEGGYAVEAALRALGRMQSHDRQEFCAGLVRHRPEAAESIAQFIAAWREKVVADIRARRKAAESDGPEARDAERAIASYALAARTLLFSRFPERELGRLHGEASSELVDYVIARFLDCVPEEIEEALEAGGDPGTAREDEPRLGSAHVGLLLAALSRPMLAMAEAEPFSLLAKNLRAMLPERLAELDRAERRRLLQFTAATQPGQYLADEVLLLAEADSWLEDEGALARAIAMLFDLSPDNEDDASTDPIFGDIGRADAAASGPSPPDAKRARDFRMMALMDAAFRKRDSDEDWSDRLAACEPDMLAALRGADRFSQFIAAWALWWIVRAASRDDPLALPPEAVRRQLWAMVEDRSLPGVVWRRVAQILVKSSIAPELENPVVAWAEAIDRQDATIGLSPLRLARDPPPVRNAGEDALRRLKAGRVKERQAAAQFLQTFVPCEEAADQLAIAIRNPALANDFMDFLFHLLVNGGGKAAGPALRDLAIEARGQAQTIALLGLTVLGDAPALQQALETMDSKAVAAHRQCFDLLLGADAAAAKARGHAASPQTVLGLVLKPRTVMVLLVRGEDPEGAPIFAYVGVRGDKLPQFMEAQTIGIFYPEEHGVVIESGDGEPGKELRERMERDYGFDHDGMTDIPDAGAADMVAEQLSRQAREAATGKPGKSGKAA